MIPENLKYTKTHEWAKIEDNQIRVGITEYAQKKLTDVVYVELPPIGKELKGGEVLCVLESVKAVSEVYSPVSGKVLDVNKELEQAPDLINSSPYDKGWLVIIEAKDLTEIDKLLNAKEYSMEIEKEEH